jgi:hypothetical protein
VSGATYLLGLRVRIKSGAWKSVGYECCVLSGAGLCDGSITHPEESYRLPECDLETSVLMRSRLSRAVQPRN